MIYVIAAELSAPERVEGRIADWLSDHSTRWCEPLPRLWIFEGALAAEQIANALDPLLEAEDRLVVVKAATEAVWRGLAKEHARWMAENFPGSITERIPDAAEGTESG